MTPWLTSLNDQYGFDTVIAHFVILSRALEAFPPPIVRIIDTQEIFAIGREQKPIVRTWIHIAAEEEIRALDRADFVWTSQQHEQRAVSAFLGEKVKLVSHFVDPLATVPEASRNSPNIIFVGANHPANVEGLRWFWSEVFPHLTKAIPAERVVVVGKVKNAFGAGLPFRFVGSVSDLLPSYRDARLAICPIHSGTGIKSKNIEAFAFGKPVVTTSFGRLGMEDADDRAQLVADGPREFASAVERLMTDDRLCRMMANEALAYAHRWNTRLRERMQDCLRGSKTSKPIRPITD
jgi:glycosyltransferase involved in cell wall biosynthesis